MSRGHIRAEQGRGPCLVCGAAPGVERQCAKRMSSRVQVQHRLPRVTLAEKRALLGAAGLKVPEGRPDLASMADPDMLRVTAVDLFNGAQTRTLTPKQVARAVVRMLGAAERIERLARKVDRQAKQLGDLSRARGEAAAKSRAVLHWADRERPVPLRVNESAGRPGGMGQLRRCSTTG